MSLMTTVNTDIRGCDPRACHVAKKPAVQHEPHDFKLLPSENGEGLSKKKKKREIGKTGK